MPSANKSQTGYTDDAYSELWYKFIGEYKKPNQDQVLKAQKYSTDAPGYYDNVISGLRGRQLNFILDYYDFHSYSTQNREVFLPLDDLLHEDIKLGLSTLKQAIIKKFADVDPEFAKSTHVDRYLYPAIKNWMENEEMRNIGSEHIGKALDVEGFITMVEVKHPYFKKAAFRCLDCDNINEVEPAGFRVEVPKKCYVCGKMRLQEDLAHSDLRDVQIIRLQERQDRTTAGNIPDTKMAVILNPHFIDTLKPGDFAALTVMVQMEKTGKNRNAIGDIYFEALGVEQRGDYSIFEQDPELEDKVRDFIRPETEDEDFERLVHSIAPTVYGHDFIKKGLILQIAGADFQRTLDGRRIRGDLQIALFGSPSTGKTALAEYVNQVYPRAIYVSGQVTGVGFTASVSYEEGVPRLEAGVYLLTSGDMGGLVICDELEKTDKEARKALAQVMDDRQQISIQKHGIHKTIQVKTASLHLANPIGDAIWDSTKSIFENTHFEHWLLTRYDLIFVLRDDYDEEKDKKIANHFMHQVGIAVSEHEIRKQTKGGEYRGVSEMIRMRADAANVLTPGEKFHTVEEIKAWQKHIRETYHPKFDDKSEAAKYILEYYLKLRKMAGDTLKMQDEEIPHSGSGKAMANAYTSMTVRQLGGMMRLACASARAHHRNNITINDAQLAIELITASMASSGYDPVRKLEYSKPIPYKGPGTNTTQAQMFMDKGEAEQDMLADRKKHGELVKRRFTKIIRKNGFDGCTDCGGGGVIMGKTCPICDGHRVVPSYLSQTAIINDARNMGVPLEDVSIMWRECLNSGYIRPSLTSDMFSITRDGIRFFLDKTGHKFLPISGKTGFSKDITTAYKQIDKAKYILDNIPDAVVDDGIPPGINGEVPIQARVVEEEEQEGDASDSDDPMNNDEWEDVPPGQESDDDVIVEEGPDDKE